MSPRKFTKVQKSNDLNQSNFSEFSLSCYRVLLNLISQIQRHDKAGNQLDLSAISRECTLSASEYAKEFNIEGNTAYEILKDATDKLLKTTFSIRLGKNILKINVCSQALYVKDEGKINIRFTEEIMPNLAELSNNFTMYNLNEIAGFGSIYTTRLYELLMQYKTTGVLTISITDLRFKIGCITKFIRYSHLKIKVIQHAVDEINSQWTLNLTFEEIKTGRTVTDLIFSFKRALQNQSYDSVKKKLRTKLTRPRKKTKNEQKIEKQAKLVDQEQESALLEQKLTTEPELRNKNDNMDTVNSKKVQIKQKELLMLEQLNEEPIIEKKPRKKIFGIF